MKAKLKMAKEIGGIKMRITIHTIGIDNKRQNKKRIRKPEWYFFERAQSVLRKAAPERFL